MGCKWLNYGREKNSRTACPHDLSLRPQESRSNRSSPCKLEGVISPWEEYGRIWGSEGQEFAVISAGVRLQLVVASRRHSRSPTRCEQSGLEKQSTSEIYRRSAAMVVNLEHRAGAGVRLTYWPRSSDTNSDAGRFPVDFLDAKKPERAHGLLNSL